MRKSAICILLLTLPVPAPSRGDSAWEQIRYICDSKQDTVRVDYVRTSEEPATGKRDTWNAWSLTISAGDDRHITGVKTVQRKCNLSDGSYVVEIKAEPCNYDTQGQNGSMTMANARILRGGRLLVDAHFGACEITGEVTTKVVVSPRLKKPQIVKVPADEYFE